jgi:hypothetical protein
MMSTTGQKPATTLLPDCIQAALFHWCAPKEMTRGEALLSVGTSYTEVYTRFNHGQPAVLPRAACSGPLPVTRNPSYPADLGRSASCGLPTRLAACSGEAGALGGVGNKGHALARAPAGAGWHGVGGRGRWDKAWWKRPCEFPMLRPL